MSSSFSSSKPMYFTKYNFFTLIASHRKKNYIETPRVSPVRRTNIIYRISFTSKNKDKGIPGGRVFLIHCLFQEILALALAFHLESTPSHLVSAVELWQASHTRPGSSQCRLVVSQTDAYIHDRWAPSGLRNHCCDPDPRNVRSHAQLPG